MSQLVLEKEQPPIQYVPLQFRKCHPDGRIPHRSRSTDAGYDIYSIEDKELTPGGATIIRTGIELAAPVGYYYTIEGRSGLWKIGIFPNRGIIDTGFNDEVVVSLVNAGPEPYFVKKFDRIAQILLHKQYHIAFDVVESFGEGYNIRGKSGFGSSGR